MQGNRRLRRPVSPILFNAVMVGRRSDMVNVPFSRVRPSDAKWPSPAEWDVLNQRLGGRLFKVQSPLFAFADMVGKASSQGILDNLQNPYFLGEQAGATQSAGWVDAWLSTPSVYAVEAGSAEDVSAAVSFAREKNLRVVIKGGGHSYQGTSCAADSLLIWTKRMDSIVIHDAFAGEGCAGTEAPQPAVTIGAGAIWGQVYTEVTTKAKRYVQGGGCTTVGVAGLIQSGGFGSFSKNYGMAASWLLEAEVVTADGVVRIANACTNPELFWGLKGGGGGTLGVVTRVTLKTHELPTWFGRAYMTIKAKSDQSFRRLIGEFFEFYRRYLFNPQWGEAVHFADKTLAMMLVCQGLDEQRIKQLWQPFLDWIAASPEDFQLVRPPTLDAMPAHNWWDKSHLDDTISDPRPGAPKDNWWYMATHGEVGAFWYGYRSVWLPDSLLLEEDLEKFLEALFAAIQRCGVSLHFNKGLAGAPENIVTAAKDTATHPTVQTAFALAIIAELTAPAYPWIPGLEPDLTTARKHAAAVDQAMNALRKVAPDSGSYVAESNFFEENWQQSFWGDHYRRLQVVKEKYDPTGLFFVHHGVGSEGWSADGFTRLIGN